jgi:hypothetical protein
MVTIFWTIRGYAFHSHFKRLPHRKRDTWEGVGKNLSHLNLEKWPQKKKWELEHDEWGGRCWKSRRFPGHPHGLIAWSRAERRRVDAKIKRRHRNVSRALFADRGGLSLMLNSPPPTSSAREAQKETRVVTSLPPGPALDSHPPSPPSTPSVTPSLQYFRPRIPLRPLLTQIKSNCQVNLI